MENESYVAHLEAILKAKNLTFKDLANHLKMPEYELIEGLDKQTLQMRTLKAMAKFLQVNLYSFFFPHDFPMKSPSKSLAALMETWDDGEDPGPQKLMEEIQFLESVLDYKKNQLAKW